jgi:hypothetical protein
MNTFCLYLPKLAASSAVHAAHYARWGTIQQGAQVGSMTPAGIDAQIPSYNLVRVEVIQ